MVRQAQDERGDSKGASVGLGPSTSSGQTGGFQGCFGGLRSFDKLRTNGGTPRVLRWAMVLRQAQDERGDSKGASVGLGPSTSSGQTGGFQGCFGGLRSFDKLRTNGGTPRVLRWAMVLRQAQDERGDSNGASVGYGPSTSSGRTGGFQGCFGGLRSFDKLRTNGGFQGCYGGLWSFDKLRTNGGIPRVLRWA